MQRLPASHARFLGLMHWRRHGLQHGPPRLVSNGSGLLGGPLVAVPVASPGLRIRRQQMILGGTFLCGVGCCGASRAFEHSLGVLLKRHPQASALGVFLCIFSRRCSRADAMQKIAGLSYACAHQGLAPFGAEVPGWIGSVRFARLPIGLTLERRAFGVPREARASCRPMLCAQ